MEIRDVGYLTEDPAREYSKGLDRCDTLEKLRAYLQGWRGLADDAIKTVEPWGAVDFRRFRRNLKEERAGRYSENDEVAVILMPEVMFKATVLSEQYACPWGTAVIRLRDAKKVPSSPLPGGRGA